MHEANIIKHIPGTFRSCKTVTNVKFDEKEQKYSFIDESGVEIQYSKEKFEREYEPC